MDVNSPMFWEYLCVALFFYIAALIGSVGNFMAFKFYRLKNQPNTSFTILIRVLSIADCIVSVFLFMGATEILFGLDFRFRYVCKVSYFLFEWAIYISIWILAEITIDRYRKVCHPFNKQITIRFAKISVPIIIATTFVLSIRNVVIYDVVSINMTDTTDNGTTVLTGYYCSNNDDPDLATVVMVFHWADIAICGCMFIIYTVIYGLITFKLIQLKNKQLSWQTTGHYAKGEKNASAGDSQFSLNIISRELSTDNNLSASVGSSDTVGKVARKKQGLRRSEYQITIMMLWVSIVFLLSLSMFFIATLFFREDVKSEVAAKPLTMWFMKNVFLNSVSNPIIYYIYNNTFRDYVNNFFRCRSQSQT